MPPKKKTSPTSAYDVKEKERDFYKDIDHYRVSVFDTPRGRCGHGISHAANRVKQITFLDGRILFH